MDRFPCEWNGCNKSYGKMSKLIEHSRSHTNNRPFVCGLCDKSFLRNGHLTRHMSTSHINEKEFHCSFDGCTKKFNLKHHLNRHLKVHENPTPYSCNVCNESFKLKSQLNNHSVLHNPEPLALTTKQFLKKKEYKCPACPLTFDKWSNLTTHKLDHRINEKSFSCDFCEKTFFTYPGRQMHQRIIHGIQDSKEHKCSFCCKCFSKKNSLDKHQSIVHFGIKAYSCDTCSKNFSYKHTLEKHCLLHK